MSSDDSPSPTAAAGDGTSDRTLAAEFAVDAALEDGVGDGPPAAVMTAIREQLSVEADATVAESVVTPSLDAVLLASVALAEGGTHGSGLMDRLSSTFGVEPSPGTLYPRLHDLAAEGTLDRHDMVRTKQYAVGDAAAAAARLDRAAADHLAVGLFLRAARDAVRR